MTSRSDEENERPAWSADDVRFDVPSGPLGSADDARVSIVDDERFREPRSHVGFTVDRQGSQPVDAGSGRGGHEPSERSFDVAAVVQMPPEEHFLHDVLRFGAYAEHAVGEGEEARAVRFDVDHGFQS
jgi:hypothetical protein